MIRTPRRFPAPSELILNQSHWTERYRQNRDGDWATAGAKQIIREALRALTYGKCVFCESPLEVSGYIEIEHYVAKTVDCSLCFEWGNLFPSCSMCNRAKGNQDHGGVLLKPDEEDPEPYFWIHGGTGELQPHPLLDEAGRRRALETIRICNLQRTALCNERAEMFERVGQWVERLRGMAEPRPEVLDAFLAPGRKYKFVLRFVLRDRKFDELCAADVARFEGEDPV